MKSFSPNKRSLSTLSRSDEAKAEGWASSATPTPPMMPPQRVSPLQNQSVPDMPPSGPHRLPPPNRIPSRTPYPPGGNPVPMRTSSPPRSGLPPARAPTTSFPDRPPAGAGLAPQRLPPPTRPFPPQRIPPPLSQPATQHPPIQQPPVNSTHPIRHQPQQVVPEQRGPESSEVVAPNDPRGLPSNPSPVHTRMPPSLPAWPLSMPPQVLLPPPSQQNEHLQQPQAGSTNPAIPMRSSPSNSPLSSSSSSPNSSQGGSSISPAGSPQRIPTPRPEFVVAPPPANVPSAPIVPATDKAPQAAVAPQVVQPPAEEPVYEQNASSAAGAVDEMQYQDWGISQVNEETLAAMAIAEVEALQSPPPPHDSGANLPVAVDHEPASPSSEAKGVGLPLSAKLTISGGTTLQPPAHPKGTIKVPNHSPLKGGVAQNGHGHKKKTEEEMLRSLDKQDREIEALKGLLNNERTQVENLKKKCFDTDKARQEMKVQVERLSTRIKFKDNEVQELMTQQRKAPVETTTQTKWDKETEMCSVDSPHSEEPDAMNTAHTSGATTFRSLQTAQKLKVSFSAGTKGGAGGPGKRRRSPKQSREGTHTMKKSKQETKNPHEMERSNHSHAIAPGTVDENHQLKVELVALKNRLRGIKRAANGDLEKDDNQNLRSTFGKEAKRLKMDMAEIFHSQLESFGNTLLAKQRSLLDDQLKKNKTTTAPSSSAASGGEEEKEDRTGAKGKTDNTKDINNTKRKLKLVYNKCLSYKSQLSELRAKDEETSKQLREQEAARQRLEEEVATLQKANESFADAAQRVPALESKLREMESLQAKCLEAEKEKKSLLLMREKAREKRKKLKEERLRLEKKVKELEEKASGAIKDRDLLAEWARGKERENEAFKRDQAIFENELHALESQLQLINAKAEQQTELLKEQELQIESLRREKEALIERCDTASSSVPQPEPAAPPQETQEPLIAHPPENTEDRGGLAGDNEAEEEMVLTGLTMPTADGGGTQLLTPNTRKLKADLDLSQLELSQEPDEASQSVSQLCTAPSQQMEVEPNLEIESSESQ